MDCFAGNCVSVLYTRKYCGIWCWESERSVMDNFVGNPDVYFDNVNFAANEENEDKVSA